MRFMVIVKATKDSEAVHLPSTELLTAMGKFKEESVKTGVMLAGEGLQPSSKGAGKIAGDLNRTCHDVMKTHNAARKQPTIRMLRVVGVTLLSLIAFAALGQNISPPPVMTKEEAIKKDLKALTGTW